MDRPTPRTNRTYPLLPYTTLFRASVAGPAGRTGPDADEDHPAGTGRLPAALPPPGGTREPRRHARPPLRRPAELRRGREWPAERLADVQRRRHVRPEPRDRKSTRLNSSH